LVWNTAPLPLTAGTKEPLNVPAFVHAVTVAPLVRPDKLAGDTFTKISPDV
jgi:hypothetical protein